MGSLYSSKSEEVDKMEGDPEILNGDYIIGSHLRLAEKQDCL